MGDRDYGLLAGGMLGELVRGVLIGSGIYLGLRLALHFDTFWF